ncbi:MAG TPA: DUF2750 domain-containing protein [Blastocatellia bacterium]|nr:DUF2750 domain-containing protein [Blastocatellia bacterium]
MNFTEDASENPTFYADIADPQSLNKYQYCYDNPLRFADPDGHSGEEIAIEAAHEVGKALLTAGAALLEAGGAMISGAGASLRGMEKGVQGLEKGVQAIEKGVGGRSGKQQRLKKLGNDPKASSEDRGCIKQDQNSVDRGSRSTIRVPPGKDLAHERGREAAKGYGYEHSHLQDRSQHRRQHKFDQGGRRNKERPVSGVNMGFGHLCLQCDLVADHRVQFSFPSASRGDTAVGVGAGEVKIMALRPEQIKAVLALPGPKRYEHFIKQVVDWEQAWGLYQDGWALAEMDDGVSTFPLWPHEDYAALCADKDWAGYEPTAIPLDELMSELLPSLQREGILPAVFFTPHDNAVTPSVEELLEHLREELKQYE